MQIDRADSAVASGDAHPPRCSASDVTADNSTMQILRLSAIVQIATKRIWNETIVGGDACGASVRYLTEI